MQPEEFFEQDEATAAKRGEALLALWHDARGDWDRAHELAQAACDADDEETARAGCWVHAYLHRVEGDSGNAAYWYAQAGRAMSEHGQGFAEERSAIAGELLAGCRGGT